MAVQLSSGVGESVARAGNLVKPKRTKLMIQQERDQKEQAARVYLSNQTKAGSVVEALRDGTFDPKAGATVSQFKQWLSALKPVDQKKLADAAGVKGSGTVGKVKVDPVAELVKWFEAGGATPIQQANRHFAANEYGRWMKLAKSVYSAEQLKDICRENGMKVGGSKDELVERIVRFLKAGKTVCEDDAARKEAVKRAGSGMTDEVKLEWFAASIRESFPSATDDQIKAAFAAHQRKTAEAKKAAAAKKAASKLPTVFA